MVGIVVAFDGVRISDGGGETMRANTYDRNLPRNMPNLAIESQGGPCAFVGRPSRPHGVILAR